MNLEVPVLGKQGVTVYVKSNKTLTGTETWGRWGVAGRNTGRGRGASIIPDYKTYSTTTYSRAVPNKQERILELVRQIAQEYGFGVKVVDAATENILHRFVRKIIKKISIFPALITDSGQKIQGEFTREQVETLFLTMTNQPRAHKKTL